MSSQPRSIQVSRMLRPLRLAFLVDPGEKAMVRSAIEACTSRWGGMASVIVPRYRRRPRDFPDGRVSANEIVGGYLSSFEPDFVVECYEGAAQGLKLEERRIGSLASLGEVDHKGELPWGLSALVLYRDAYEREFRFRQRDPLKTFLPSCDSGADELLIDALFGRLPCDENLAFLASSYQEAFRPESVEIDSSNLHDLLLSGPGLTPLNVTMKDLKPDRLSMRRHEPCFMVLRPAKSADVIDFWNLRALGARVAAVPATRIEEFVAAYAKLREENAIRVAFRSEGGREAMAIKARGAAEADLERFAAAMAEAGFPLPRQPWFPTLWDPHHLRLNNWSRVPFEADSDRIEIGAPDGRIRFAPLAPSFADSDGGFSPSWANAIQLHEYDWSSDLAPVLPPDFGEMARLLGSVGQHTPRTSSEGIVVTPQWAGLAESWSLPRGNAVFASWLADRGFQARPSAAGRTAEQLIATLGGPTMAALIEEPKLIELIHRASQGLAEEADAEGGPRRRVISFKDLHRVLREVNDNSEEQARSRLARLLEQNVLRQGLMVRCPLCEQQNWYSLEDLHTTLGCERCLREFPFPRERPPSTDQWAYRPNGPFSIGNYAEGGYAVALALRFFLSSTVSHGDATWTTSMELSSPDRLLEFDFALWLREELEPSATPKLILGECKTFGRFEASDFARAIELSQIFPESLVVMATLREELEPKERAAFAELLAEHPDLGRYGRLIVLTANELCGSDTVIGPPYRWKGKGGKFDEVAERYQARFDLEDLGRASLELYVR